MDESTRGHLEFLAVQLAAVFAGIHFYWAFPRLVQALQSTIPVYQDPRPLLFVGLAAVVLAGMVLIGQGILPRSVGYAAGIALAGTSILGWAAWHLGGHAALLPWAENAPAASHVGDPLAVLVEHAVGDPIEGLSKLVELALIAVLTALLVDDHRADATSDDRPASATR